VSSRLKRFTDWLKEEDIDFAFVTDPTNVFYYTGFMCHPHERVLALVAFPEAEPFLFCPSLEVRQAKASGWPYDVIGYNDDENPWEKIRRALADRGIGQNVTVAIETDTLPYGRSEAIKRFAESVRFVSAEGTINAQRLIKDEAELASLKKAAELADYAVQIGKNAIKKGKTEQAIVAEIEYELKKRGVEGMAFTTMVLVGQNSALPHGVPGDRQIREGDFVLFDLGVIADGYCSDITRTFVYKHASDEQIAIYETVLKAEEAAIRAATAGTVIADVDRTARRIITDAGYGEYFTHRVGHGLGLGAHEAPSMSGDNLDVIKTGMVFTIEPGIYVPEIGGVRIEDDIYVGEAGPVCLTSFPKQLEIIP